LDEARVSMTNGKESVTEKVQERLV